MVDKNLKRVYLFTGENVYMLSKELKRWKTVFSEKNGWDSVFSFNRENRDYNQIKQIIFGWWLFVSNKLVILYGVPLDTEKSNVISVAETEKLVDDIMGLNIPSGVLIVCVSYKPDKRNRFYKWIDKLNKENPSEKIIKSFDVLSRRELFDFVTQESSDLNLNSDVVEFLVQKVWYDQFRLCSEIEKLRYWKKYYEKEITVDALDEVCFWLVEEDVFQVLDLILTDPKSALRIIQWFQDDGLDRNALNGSLLWWLRNYLFVLDYAEYWPIDSKSMAANLKQNPWILWNVVKKLPLLKEKRELIQKLFKNVVDIDYDIKNGNAYPESYFFTIKKILLSN